MSWQTNLIDIVSNAARQLGIVSVSSMPPVTLDPAASVAVSSMPPVALDPAASVAVNALPVGHNIIDSLPNVTVNTGASFDLAEGEALLALRALRRHSSHMKPKGMMVRGR